MLGHDPNCFSGIRRLVAAEIFVCGSGLVRGAVVAPRIFGGVAVFTDCALGGFRIPPIMEVTPGQILRFS